MTGGTRKRGATWSYYFDLGKIDGKRQKKEKGGFKTKKEAETALAKLSTNTTTPGRSLPRPKSPFRIIWISGMICTVNRI